MTRFFQKSIREFRSVTIEGVKYVHSAKLSCGHTHTYQRRQLWPSKRTTAPCKQCGAGRRYLRKSESATVSCVVPVRLPTSRQVEMSELEIARRIEAARPSTQYARQVEPRDVSWLPRAIWAAMHGSPAQREAVREIVALALEQAQAQPHDAEQERRNERTITQAQIAGLLDRPRISRKDQD